MNFDLNKVVENIAMDNEMSQEFSRLDEIDEIYDYCRNMGASCSEEEFDESVAKYIDALDQISYDYNDESLEKIAGGAMVGKPISKALAVILSAFTVGSTGFFNSASAIKKNDNSNTVSTVSKVSTWSKIKKSAANFYKNHKKSIIGTGVTLGAMVLAGGTVFLGKKAYVSR